VPIPEDERIDDQNFEAHLKQFRPLAPGPLQIEGLGSAPRHPFLLAAWTAAAAAALVVAVIVFHSRTGEPRATPPIESLAGAEQLVNTPSLTIRSANALLASAPSFQAAVDEMAFSAKATPLPKDKHSALAELSKEKTKL
jgi:hypothetical protein